MILDLIVIVIFILSALRGKARGFGDSAIRLIALAASCVLGMLGTRPLSEFIFATNFDEWILGRLTDLAGSGEIDILPFIPKVIRNVLLVLGQSSIPVNLRHFTNTLVLILSFLIIVFLISLISVRLRRSLQRHRRKGTVIGTVDSSVGLLFGMVKGAIWVFLFLALMFPACGLFAPDKIVLLNENLNHSFIAGPLYHWNPLLVFIRNLPL